MERPRWHRSVVWAVAFSVVTTAGLGLLTWAIGMMDALSYGAMTIVAPEGVTAPRLDRYPPAFAAGAGVNLAAAVFLAWLVSRTPVRGWAPLILGATAALIGATVGAWVLLRILGIGLVEFVSAV